MTLLVHLLFAANRSFVNVAMYWMAGLLLDLSSVLKKTACRIHAELAKVEMK